MCFLPFLHSPLCFTVIICSVAQAAAFSPHKLPYVTPSDPQTGVQSMVQTAGHSQYELPLMLALHIPWKGHVTLAQGSMMSYLCQVNKLYLINELLDLSVYTNSDTCMTFIPHKTQQVFDQQSLYKDTRNKDKF